MKKGFGDFFTDSWKEYSEKFLPVIKSFLFLYLIPLLILASLVFIFLFSVVGVNMAFFESLSSGNVNEFRDLVFSSTILIPTLVVVLTSIVLFLAINFLLTLNYIHISLSKKPSFADSFNRSRGDFWRFVGFSIVFFIFTTLLFALFFIPGIIFMVFWIFSTYVFIYERKGIIDSLKTSFNMVKGNWWKTFGYLIVLSLFTSVISSLVGIIPFAGNIVNQAVLFPFALFFIKNWYFEVRKGFSKKK